MKEYTIMMGLIAACLFATGGLAPESALDAFLDGLAGDDVSGSDEVGRTSLTNDFPRLLQDLQTSENGLRDRLDERIRSLSTNRDLVANSMNGVRLNTAMNFMGEYFAADCAPAFRFVMTNSLNRHIVESASFLYVTSCGGTSDVLGFYRGTGPKSLIPELRYGIFSGLCSAFESSVFDEDATNRMVSLCLDYLSECRIGFGRADWELCRVWPEYSVSSNRLTGALSWTADEDRYTRTDYVNEIKSTLLSKPADSLPFLPTNHFQSAWQ